MKYVSPWPSAHLFEALDHLISCVVSAQQESCTADVFHRQALQCKACEWSTSSIHVHCKYRFQSAVGLGHPQFQGDNEVLDTRRELLSRRTCRRPQLLWKAETLWNRHKFYFTCLVFWNSVVLICFDFCIAQHIHTYQIHCKYISNTYQIHIKHMENVSDLFRDQAVWPAFSSPWANLCLRRQRSSSREPPVPLGIWTASRRRFFGILVVTGIWKITIFSGKTHYKPLYNHCLVLWNHRFFNDFPIILGISSSQLTFSFFRGVGQPPSSLPFGDGWRNPSDFWGEQQGIKVPWPKICWLFNRSRYIFMSRCKNTVIIMLHHESSWFFSITIWSCPFHGGTYKFHPFQIRIFQRKIHGSVGISPLKNHKISKLLLGIASGKLTVCYGKWPIYRWFTLLKIVFFYSYVSLPEGIRSRFRDASGGTGAKMRKFGHRRWGERRLQSLPSGQWLDYEKNLGRFFCGFGWKWFIGPKKKWDKPSINHPPVITILMVV